MDHATIEEQQIVDRYVMGTLPPVEAARFEEHYLSCPECLDRLELAEAELRGFKRAAAQDTARLATVRQLALVAWLSRLGRSRQMAVLLTITMVLLLLPAGLTLRQRGELDRLGGELSETRSALEQERERSATGSRDNAAESEKLRSELDASLRELAREREARSREAEQLAQARRPQGNVPILFLNAERGAGPAAGEPTHRLRLPHEPGWIVLALEVDPPHSPSYRAVLRDAGGRELWRGDGLRVNELEALSLSLPTSLLAPGDYSLAVEGLAPGARPAPAGRFAFRVLPPA
jgi:hypothetical protein